MISAARLKLLSNLSADDLIEMLGDEGTDQPFIATCFMGVEVNGNLASFFYEAHSLLEDDELHVVNLAVIYDKANHLLSIDYV